MTTCTPEQVNEHQRAQGLIPVDEARGTWVDRDAAGDWYANVMVELGTISPEHLQSLLALPCEVRFGIIADNASPAEVAAWIARFESEFSRLAGIAQLTRIDEEQPMRMARQFVWARLWLPDQDMDKLRYQANELARNVLPLCAMAGNYLAATQPVKSWREIRATHGDIRKSLDHDAGFDVMHWAPAHRWVARAMAPAATADIVDFAQAVLKHGSVKSILWLDWVPKDRMSVHQALRQVQHFPRKLFGSIGAGRLLRLAESAARGEWGDVRLEITLVDPDDMAIQLTQSYARRAGLVLKTDSDRRWGVFEPPQFFRATREEVNQWIPLQELSRLSPLASGGLLLLNEYREPVVFDPLASATYVNVAIAGMSGSGRSLLGYSLVAAHVATGRPAWVIEHAAEDMTAFCELVGGAAVTITAQTTGLSPMAAVHDFESEQDLLLDWLQVLLADSQVPAEIQHRLLATALRTAWADRAESGFSLSTLIAALLQDDSAYAIALASELAQYTDGKYGPLFSEPSLPVATQGLQLFAIELPDTVARIAGISLTTLISLRMRHIPAADRKMLYIPETERWSSEIERNAPREAAVSGWLTRQLRAARKNSCSIVTGHATPDLESKSPTALWRATEEYSGWRVLCRANLHDRAVTSWMGQNVERFLPQLRMCRNFSATFLLSGPLHKPALYTLVPGELMLAATTQLADIRAEYRVLRNQGESPLRALKRITRG